MFLLKDFLFVGCFAWVVMCRRGVALQFLNQKQKNKIPMYTLIWTVSECVCVCVCARGWRRVSVCAAAFASLSWTETTEPLAKTGDTLCMAIEEKKPARIRTSSLTFSPSSLKLVKNKTAQTRRPCCLLASLPLYWFAPQPTLCSSLSLAAAHCWRMKKKNFFIRMARAEFVHQHYQSQSRTALSVPRSNTYTHTQCDTHTATTHFQIDTLPQINLLRAAQRAFFFSNPLSLSLSHSQLPSSNIIIGRAPLFAPAFASCSCPVTLSTHTHTGHIIIRQTHCLGACIDGTLTLALTQWPHWHWHWRGNWSDSIRSVSASVFNATGDLQLDLYSLLVVILPSSFVVLLWWCISAVTILYTLLYTSDYYWQSVCVRLLVHHLLFDAHP